MSVPYNDDYDECNANDDNNNEANEDKVRIVMICLLTVKNIIMINNMIVMNCVVCCIHHQFIAL